MSPEELRAIKARADSATPGPWTSPWDEDEPDETASFRAADHEEVVSVAEYDCNRYLTVLKEDATFIAHARTDVPALFAEVTFLQMQVNWLFAEAEDEVRAKFRRLREGDDG